jgi:hypothetical protein
MKKSTCMKLSATALAVLLAATMFSLPAAAKSVGPDRGGQVHDPDFGPCDPGYRFGPNEGKGDPKDGGSKYKLGAGAWRALDIGIGGVRRLLDHNKYVIILSKPVWIPGLTFDHKGVARE